MLAKFDEMQQVEILLVCQSEVFAEVFVLELKLKDNCLNDFAGPVDDHKSVARRFA